MWKALEAQLVELKGFLEAMLASIFNFLRGNIVLILILSTAGLFAGFGWYKAVPVEYAARMTVSYVQLEKKIYADMVGKLGILVQNGKTGRVAELLGLDPEVARNLKAVMAYNIKNKPLIEDLSVEKIPFYIEVRVSELPALKPLEEAFVHFLNSPKFVQERLEFTKERSEQRIRHYQSEIALLKEQRQNLAGMKGNGETSFADLNAAIGEAYKNLEEAKAAIIFNNNIEVLDGFVSNEIPANKSLKKSLAVGLLSGFGFALCLGFFRGRDRRQVEA